MLNDIYDEDIWENIDVMEQYEEYEDSESGDSCPDETP